MNSVLQDFRTRSHEVEGYFRFVLRLTRREVSLHSQDPNNAITSHEHEELLRTLKATSYLLLYNLVESTMRNAIEAIFIELQERGVAFDDCREELRREILKNFKKRDVDNLLPKLLSLARDVIYHTFERAETFSGNLDARTIKQTAKRFGFAEPQGTSYWMLRTIKDHRNDLAHGVKSFAEVGRDASATDLERARNQTVAILTETLDNIRDYLSRQGYLEASNVPPIPQS